MRGRKKEASKVKQTNKAKQHSTPKAVTFPRKNGAASGGTRTHDTLYSRQSALPTELPRQLSWLDPNLTSHSTPDEQANHQLSMKEKAGVTKPPMTPNTKPSIYMYMYMYMFLNERHVHVSCLIWSWGLPSLVPRPFSYAHAREGKEGSGK